MKTCSRCSETKELSEFYDSKRNVEGKQPRCKSCAMAYQHAWRGKNRDVLNLRMRERHTKERTKRINNNRKCRYGVSSEAYAEMMSSQDFGCGICGLPETLVRGGVVQSLAIDHCHVSGKVRGLLCAKCNQALGLLAHDPHVLFKAIDYILKIR